MVAGRGDHCRSLLEFSAWELIVRVDPSMDNRKKDKPQKRHRFSFDRKYSAATLGGVAILLSLFTYSCSLEEWAASSKKTTESVVVISTSSVEQAKSPTVEPINYDKGLIDQTMRAAPFEFNNRLMYRDPAAWTGRVVAITGLYPGTGTRAKEFVENDNQFFLRGDYNGPIRVLVNLDHPLPRREIFGGSSPLLSGGQTLFVFGKLSTLKNVMDDDGNTRAIIQMDCILIFDGDDFKFQRPLWVTAKYEQLPDGTVTTDTLIYEFDRRK